MSSGQTRTARGEGARLPREFYDLWDRSPDDPAAAEELERKLIAYLQENEEDADAWQMLGSITIDDSEKQIQCYRRALSIDPLSPGAHAEIALLGDFRGSKTTELRSHLEAVLDNCVGHPERIYLLEVVMALAEEHQLDDIVRRARHLDNPEITGDDSQR